MKNYSRRKFLKQIGAVAALCLTSRTAFSFPNFLESEKDFEMLVVGDSVIAGQGLAEEHKFSTLTKNWLQNEIFGESRKVNYKNKSHSGSKLFLSAEEKKALTESKKDLDKFYHPEVNFSFPDMKTQIDVALQEYKSEGIKAQDVNLIMLTGGLTNIGSANIINPFNSNQELKKLTEKYCNDEMFEFLQYANQSFPNAWLTVIGYFPMVSKKSSTGEIYDAILELYEFPRPTKPLMNNLLTKQFFKILHNKMNKRSRIWFESSNQALQTAVRRFNEQKNMQKAVFVKSPVTEETCFGTKNALLFGVGKKGRTEDELYDIRQKVCSEEINKIKDVKLKFKTRFCEMSAVGHPNIEGSKEYFEAIRQSLTKNNKSLFSKATSF